MNVGAVENEGYDISLSVMPIQDYERQIQWSISMNGSHNRNVIKKISNEMEGYESEKSGEKEQESEAIYEEGKSTTQFVVPSVGVIRPRGKKYCPTYNRGEKPILGSAG